MADLIKILKALEKAYPQSQCELTFRSPFELLVSTILSAQAMDKKVNEVTARLFEKYNTPEAFAGLTQEMLEQEIRQIHFYPQKARYILLASRELLRRFDGVVPADRESLIHLPGVGRKTANVILSYAFQIPSIAVDTHVFRVSNRLGIACTKTPQQTELEMERVIPKDWWIRTHSCLVLHGRRVCNAKKPECGICTLKEYCKHFSGGAEWENRIIK